MLSLSDLDPIVAYSEAMGEAFFAMDRDWRIRVLNTHAAAYAAIEAQSVLGSSYWDVVPGARGSTYEAGFVRAMGEGVRVEIEAESSLRPGRVARGVAIPLRDGLAVSFRDVTQQRRTESERERRLRDSESRLRLAQSAARIGIYDWDVASGAIRWSPEMFDLYAIDPATPPDRIYEAWLARLHPEDRERAERETRAFLDRDGPIEIVFRIVRPDGEVRWVEGRGRVEPGADGHPIRMMGANIDVTGRKRAEEAARESEAKLRTIANNLPNGMVYQALRRPDGTVCFTYVSDAVERLHGVSAQDVIADPTVLDSQIVDGYRQRLEQIRRDAAGVSGPLSVELPMRVPSGEIRWFQRTSHPRRQADGTSVWDGVEIDITDLKRAEEHQRLLVAELNHRVKNTLAIVQAIAAQSFKEMDGHGAARQAFEGRLIALSNAHDILTRENWQGARLHQIAHEVTAPYRVPAPGRFLVEGPDVRLPPKLALALAMAIHELCTNAVKYGALANADGRVHIAWTIAGERATARCRLQWREEGGPPVREPSKTGFGTRLIQRSLSREFGGEVRMIYDPAGFVCIIEAPLESDEPSQTAAPLRDVGTRAGSV